MDFVKKQIDFFAAEAIIRNKSMKITVIYEGMIHVTWQGGICYEKDDFINLYDGNLSLRVWSLQ